MEWLTIPAAIVSTLGAIVVAWMGKRTSATAEKIRTTTPPYDALATRVAALEAEVDEARKTIHRLATDLDTERASRRAAEARMADVERLLAVEQARSALLADRASQLEAELHAAGLPVPPSPATPPNPTPGGLT